MTYGDVRNILPNNARSTKKRGEDTPRPKWDRGRRNRGADKEGLSRRLPRKGVMLAKPLGLYPMKFSPMMLQGQVAESGSQVMTLRLGLTSPATALQPHAGGLNVDIKPHPP